MPKSISEYRKYEIDLTRTHYIITRYYLGSCHHTPCVRITHNQADALEYFSDFLCCPEEWLTTYSITERDLDETLMSKKTIQQCTNDFNHGMICHTELQCIKGVRS